MKAENCLLSLTNVSKQFGSRSVLRNVDLGVNSGEFVVIVGASGSGKSTLLRLLANLEAPSQGRLALSPSYAVGFQDARLLPWSRVDENVLFGVPGTRRERRRLALALLDEVGLASHARAWPHTLSGGQAQRVSLARALALRPRVLLLDEPFGALDALTRLKMHALLQRLWREHALTVVLVTHDVEEAVVLADRVVILDDGRIVDQFDVSLARPRTRGTADFEALRSRILTGLAVDESAE